MAAKGKVFNIQRFSIHDGPGIRTTVFMKGCPLACPWCANPESQSIEAQLMKRDMKCVGCGACVRACTKNAIRCSKKRGRQIDWTRCDHCLQCVEACRYGALSAAGEVKTVGEVAEIVARDQIFYRNSGGGVTLSGGEPLVQHDFLLALMEIVKSRNLHIALDTTGYAPKEAAAKILPFVDLVLFDIKHLDSRKHKALTGMDNALILENAQRFAKRVRTWFRVPLIMGVNDSEDHIAEIANMARALGIEKISLLPFHEGGFPKWGQIGKKRPEFMGQAPDEQHIKRLCEIIVQRRVMVGIRN